VRWHLLSSMDPTYIARTVFIYALKPLRISMPATRGAQVRLYQRFTFDLVPGQEPLKLHTTITISPAGGLHVRVVPRAAQGAE
jgi:hypothetical protein